MFFFFFNDTATTDIYTLSLHDALPIYACSSARFASKPFSAMRISSTVRKCRETEECLAAVQGHKVCGPAQPAGLESGEAVARPVAAPELSLPPAGAQPDRAVAAARQSLQLTVDQRVAHA